MKRDLRIVFMGTPDFAVGPLDALLKAGYVVVGVITAPDKPAGRGRKLRESAVKLYAKEKGLPILQPTNLKHPTFLKALSALGANLQVVVAFRMLPEVVWRMPVQGTFNLHASLLPDYRGAAPINWAIINGETKTGVTTFFIDDKIDTGEVILQRDIPIQPHETAGTLHDKLMNIGSQLVVDTVALIEKGPVTTTPQPADGILKTAHKLNKDNCRIDWHASLDAIYNKVRGLSPYPSAWCTLQNGSKSMDIKVYDVTPQLETHDLETGSLIVTKNEVRVAVKNGFIILNEIQLPGKRKMAVRSLLNGFNFHAEAKML